MISVDMVARFIPSFVSIDKLSPEERRKATVKGNVVFVNYGHKYFTAEYDYNGRKLLESFNFSDCGKTVDVREH